MTILGDGVALGPRSAAHVQAEARPSGSSQGSCSLEEGLGPSRHRLLTWHSIGLRTGDMALSSLIYAQHRDGLAASRTS